MAYYEICDAGYTVVKKNGVQAPYGYKGNAWVGFDDQDSLIHKVKTQVKGITFLDSLIIWRFYYFQKSYP